MNLLKHPYALIALAVALVSCREVEVPSEISKGQLMLRVTNSLAIPNHEVGVEISGDQIVVTRRDNNKKGTESSDRLSPDEAASIWKSVDSINWRSVEKDDALGLDGTSYLVRFGEREYEVWTPESDTKERELSGLLDLKSLLWRIADIPAGEQVDGGNQIQH